ncbi:hypothetical protein ALC62_15749, partial [Cyphomyrmex costatus]
VDIPSLLVETFPRFERQRQFASAMVSQNDLHVTRWINVDCNFQKLVASSGGKFSFRKPVATSFLSQLSMYSFYREFIYVYYCLYFYDVLSFDDVLFPAFFFNGGGGGGIRGRSVSMCTRSSRNKSRSHVRFSRPLTYTTAKPGSARPVGSCQKSPWYGIRKNVVREYMSYRIAHLFLVKSRFKSSYG